MRKLNIHQTIIIFGIAILGLGICLQTVNYITKSDQKNNKTSEKSKKNLNTTENTIEKAKKILLKYNPRIEPQNLEYISKEKGLYKIRYNNQDRPNEKIVYIVNIKEETYEVQVTVTRGGTANTQEQG